MKKIILIIGLILIFLLLLNTLNSVNNEDLSVDIMTFAPVQIHEEKTVEVYFQYEWSKNRYSTKSETIELEWNPEWQLVDYNIEFYEKDKKVDIKKTVDNNGNNLIITLDNNNIFNSADSGEGSIYLRPNDMDQLKQMYMSSASITFEHNNLFGQLKEADSVGWQNELFIK